MRTLFARSNETLALVAGVFVLAISAPARADDLSLDLPVFGHSTFSMTSTTTARYRGQNYDNNPFDDDFASIQQRFDLALQGDELRLEVRLDTFIPFAFDETVTYGRMPVQRAAWFGSAGSCPDAASSFCYLAWDLRPERMVLRWDHESWSVELGDAQLVIGRGAALSFRKVDLLAVDTALRGAHIRYDDGHFRARVHAGIANPQNQDSITLGIFQDPLDIFAAGSIGATFGPDDAFIVSGHAVRVWFENGRGATEVDRAIDILGWTMEAPALADGHLALYAEANGMRRSTTLMGTGIENHEFGRSVYGSAQLQLDNLTVLVEWKDYRNFLVTPSLTAGTHRIYNAAPSLEFDGPQRLRAFGNQRGASIRIDYGFAPGPWQFSVNGTVYGLDENMERDPWDGILVTHGWLTLQRRLEYNEGLNWSINASAGFREESIIQPEEFSGRTAGEMDRRVAHGMIDLTLGEGEHSFDIVLDHRYEQEHPGGGTTLNEFQIGGASVTYTYNVQFAATLMLRWSDFVEGEAFQRGQQSYNFLGGNMYPSIELRWNFDPGTFIRGFFGSTPGGVICSGGVCRQVPPYEGALLQFVARI